MRRIDELTASIQGRRLSRHPAAASVPRLQLVTVTALTPSCPVCEGPRRYWGHVLCSQKCAKVAWERRNAEKRREYWRTR